MLLRNTEYP